jgi:hypothetical protein
MRRWRGRNSGQNENIENNPMQSSLGGQRRLKNGFLVSHELKRAAGRKASRLVKSSSPEAQCAPTLSSLMDING